MSGDSGRKGMVGATVLMDNGGYGSVGWGGGIQRSGGSRGHTGVRSEDKSMGMRLKEMSMFLEVQSSVFKVVG